MEKSTILGIFKMKPFFLAVFLFAGAAWADEVDPALCRDIGFSQRTLVPPVMMGWMKFPHGVQLCPAYAADGKFLWWIATIRLDMLGDNEFEDRELHPPKSDGFGVIGYPRPRIVDATGQVIGLIPDAFPTPNPGRTHVVLENWQDGYPWQIDIKVADAPPEGGYDGPSLQWNADTHRYDQIGRSMFDDDP